MTPKPPLTSRVSNILLVVTASLCWSTSGIFISLIIQRSSLSAVSLAFWRDLTTALVLFIGILILQPNHLIVKREDLPWLMGMGTISIGVFHIFWNKAVVMVGASLATVVQCNAPIFVTIMAWFLFQEKITPRKIIAVVLAATGTVLVSGINITGEWKILPIGLFIGLASAITYGSLSLFGKKLSGKYNPWTIMFYAFAFGSLTLFLFQLGRPDPWPIGSGVLPLFIGFIFISTIIGFSLYTRSLRYLPASIAAITATSEILFATILAYLFLGERMDLWQAAGSILIVVGVVLVSLTKKQNTVEVGVGTDA